MQEDHTRDHYLISLQKQRNRPLRKHKHNDFDLSFETLILMHITCQYYNDKNNKVKLIKWMLSKDGVFVASNFLKGIILDIQNRNGGI